MSDRVFFSTPNHHQIIETIREIVEREGGLVVVSGQAGAGKTALGTVILERFVGDVPTCFILNPALSADEVLGRITQDLRGVAVGAGAGTSSQLPAKGLLIVDEAHALPRSSLALLLDVAGDCLAAGRRLTTVFLAQPEFVAVLAEEALRKKPPHAISRLTLHPFTADQTAAYVREHYREAGLNKPVGFGEEALRDLHRFSQGIPRSINELCAKASQAAALKGMAVVDRDLMALTAREMGALTPPWEGDVREAVGAAGWLGVCLVVLVVITLILTSPRMSRPPAIKKVLPLTSRVQSLIVSDQSAEALPTFIISK